MANLTSFHQTTQKGKGWCCNLDTTNVNEKQNQGEEINKDEYQIVVDEQNIIGAETIADIN